MVYYEQNFRQSNSFAKPEPHHFLGGAGAAQFYLLEPRADKN
jgi:hypothetical protein